jgi:hypothetical protein
MGWGLKLTAGHCLDLCAAMLGLSFFPAGLPRALAEKTFKKLVSFFWARVPALRLRARVMAREAKRA